MNRIFRAPATCPPDNGIAPPQMGESIRSPRMSEIELARGLTDLRAAMSDMNLAMLIGVPTRLVPEYQPSTYLLQQAAAHLPAR